MVLGVTMDYEILKLGNKTRHTITCKICGSELDVNNIFRVTLQEIVWDGNRVFIDKTICNKCNNEIEDLIRAMFNRRFKE